MFDSLLRGGQATYIAQRLFQLPDSQALVRLDDVAFSTGLFRFAYMLGRSDQRMRQFRGVEIVGSLKQGTDTAHVIYRYALPPDSLPIQSYLVQTMLRCGAGWCANMLGDFRELHRLLTEPRREQ